MKKMMTVVLVVAFVGLFCFASWFETHYTRQDCVVVSYVEDVVTVEDTCGYTWDFIGDGYEVGDVVDLKMYTNHTDSTIYDDVIEDVKRVD